MDEALRLAIEMSERNWNGFMADPKGVTQEEINGRLLPQLHLAMHRGQIRTLRNLYRKTSGKPGLFFPHNLTFPEESRADCQLTSSL